MNTIDPDIAELDSMKHDFQTDDAFDPFDPLDDDQPADQMIATTRRAIRRVALIAAETGARFAKEGIPIDPVKWMTEPLVIFDGRRAVDACLEKEACFRVLLLHGLGLGIDAVPSALDGLMLTIGNEFPDGFEDGEFEHLYGAAPRESKRAGRAARLRLYTATIMATRDNTMVQAFHASIARDRTEIAERLTVRFGREIAKGADIRLGFHESSPLVIALVPAGLDKMLRRVQADCTSNDHRNFAVDIQQVIHA